VLITILMTYSLTCVKAPTKFNIKQEKNKPNVYPNPTSGKININVDNINLIEIMDINGKILYSGKENEIDLSIFQCGIYYVSIVANERTIIEKIIKQ